MSSKRMFYVLSGCLALLAIAGIGSVYLGNNLLKASADKLNNLKLQTSVIDEQQNSIVQAKRDIEKYAELEKIAKSIVPQDKDQARTIREIVKFASEAGVPISSITFPESELGNAVLRPPTPAPAAGTAAPTGPVTPPVSQVTPVEGIKGVYQLQITLQNDKDSPARYQSFINFLRKLEQNRRTSQVTNVGIQPEAANRNLITYSMDINVYIKP